MLIHVIDSGSKGNGYVIDANGELLLLECGVKAKDMLKAVKFKTSSVAGCLVSHEHT